jgi:hypothetical protein
VWRSKVHQETNGSDSHRVERPIDDRGKEHRKDGEGYFCVRRDPHGLSLRNEGNRSEDCQLPERALKA